jgi:hypothetical protein
LGRGAERQGGKGKQQHTAAAAENLERHGLSPVGASYRHLYFLVARDQKSDCAKLLWQLFVITKSR